MQHILRSYLKRLTNLSGNNRSLLLLKLSKEQDLDLHDIDFLNDAASFEIIRQLVQGKKKIKLVDSLDSRNEKVNNLSNQLRKIHRRETFIFEERGAKDLYVGWPFVHGKLQDGTQVRCPLLFFPTKYHSKITGEDHVGEVNPAGHMAFSWKAFVEGYIDPEDTYNLGLHEMAHALSLENGIKNQEYNFLNPADLKTWRILADAEFEKMKLGGYKTFLRRYAFSNRDEFFPVCVEHFFEKPVEFKNEAPQLYKALCNLLNQDPAKTKSA